jgi:hypothetical protein
LPEPACDRQLAGKAQGRALPQYSLDHLGIAAIFAAHVFRFNSVYGRATPRGATLGRTRYGIAIRKPVWALARHLQWAVYSSEPLGSLDGVAFNSPIIQPLIY